MEPITFSVTFSLKEYLHFVKNHALVVINKELITRGKPARDKVPLWLSLLILLPAATGFYFKKRAMPVCAFKIDADGIERTTNARRYAVPWERVVAIHKYPQGTLFAGATGAMPVPNRCLDASQLLRLNALIEKRQVAIDMAAGISVSIESNAR